MSKKKRNIFVRFFCAIGRGIKNFFLLLEYGLIYMIFAPKAKCKVIGKQNISKTDEARVFVANHYEIFGPIATYLCFPLKHRPWVIDKMLDRDSVEKQMSISIYNNFPTYPMWFKRFVIKAIRDLIIFVLNRAGAISVSREDIRANIKTMQESTKTLNKKIAILIFPEDKYVEKGVGEFQTGFEHLGKYYYQKTGKKISFYPTFVSQENKEYYIGQPIVFNPENDANDEKEKIVEYLHSSMEKLYKEHEIDNPKPSKKSKNKKSENTPKNNQINTKNVEMWKHFYFLYNLNQHFCIFETMQKYIQICQIFTFWAFHGQIFEVLDNQNPCVYNKRYNLSLILLKETIWKKYCTF